MRIPYIQPIPLNWSNIYIHLMQLGSQFYMHTYSFSNGVCMLNITRISVRIFFSLFFSCFIQAYAFFFHYNSFPPINVRLPFHVIGFSKTMVFIQFSQFKITMNYSGAGIWKKKPLRSHFDMILCTFDELWFTWCYLPSLFYEQFPRIFHSEYSTNIGNTCIKSKHPLFSSILIDILMLFAGGVCVCVCWCFNAFQNFIYILTTVVINLCHLCVVCWFSWKLYL